MSKLTEIEQNKIKRALLIFETEDKIPKHYIGYIRDGLFEFRVTCENKEFRLFFIYMMGILCRFVQLFYQKIKENT